jgi:putative flavoprotein involved in K+ transport
VIIMEKQVEVAVIGAGQAGLAMGYYLAQQGRRFVILDGAPRIGQSWRVRYDSLKLFTPAQYNNLPGLPFPAPADHYPTKDEVADYLERYAKTHRLPVQLNTRVQALKRGTDGYLIETEGETYCANQVVIATGPFQRPFTPPFATGLAAEVFQIHSSQYRNPEQLPPGPVLVVGAGNSGAQIAEELSLTRKVYLSVGTRPPYRPQRVLGRSLFWWLDKLGVMNLTRDTWLGRKLSAADPLIGTDLNKMARERGVELLGRAEKAAGKTVTFTGGRTLPVSTIVWATGFRPDFRWVQVPVFDDRGVPIHQRGVTAAPGLYFLGLRWQHTQGSGLLGGVGRDAAFLAAQIAEQAQEFRSRQEAVGGGVPLVPDR